MTLFRPHRALQRSLLLGLACLLASALALPGQAQQPTDPATRAQQLLIEGMTRAYLDDPDGALARYDEALKLTPNEPAILAATASAHEALDDLSTAQFYAEQARRFGADQPHYWHELARLHVRIGNLDQALEVYDALLERFPDNAEAYHEAARLRIRVGRFAEALATLDALQAQTGPSPEVQEQMLQLYLQLDDAAGAEGILRELLDASPYEARYARLLADVLAGRGDVMEATELLETVVTRDPGDTEAVLALSELYRQQGRADEAAALLDEALGVDGASADQLVARASALRARATDDPGALQAVHALLDEALRQEPRHPAALLMKGDLLYRTEAYAAAAPLLRRALDTDPRDLQLWIRTASAYLQAGQPREAADVADEGLLLFPGQLPLLRIAAYSLLDATRNDAAYARFEEALAILREEAPDDPAQESDFLSSMALLEVRRDNEAAADSLYARALDLDPDNALALNNYAYHLAARGERLDDARRLAEQAVAADPNASFLDTLGWIHVLQGDLAEGERLLQQAINTGAASAAAYEHLGDLYARQQRPDDARRLWQEALERRPDDDALRRKIEQAGQ